MKKDSREVITYRDVFIADDGTEFSSEESCKKYEESYECVIKSRFYSIAKKVDGGYSDIDTLLDCDNCNSDYYFVTPKTDTDINIICQFVKLNYGPISVQGGEKILGNGNIQLGETYIVLEGECWAGIYHKDCVIADYKEKLEKFSKLFDEEEKENG